MSIYLGGEEYQDEASFEALTHPAIPDSLKTLFKMPLESPEKPAGALKSQPGTPVAPEISASPEPSQSVDWSRMNQPTGQLEMTQMGDSPVQRQLDDFMTQASKPAPKTLSEGSEESIKTATDIVMSFGAGTIAGTKSAALMAGKTPFTLATTAERQGFSADEIFKSTGFFKGADGKWRYEIDDSAASYFPENLKGGQKFLSDILSHKELFDAYPQLKTVKVREAPELGAGASYTESTQTLLMGSQALKDKGIFMHEVQHAIQGIEGFSKGGMPGKAGRDFQLKYEQDIRELRPEMLKLGNKVRSGEFLSQKEQARFDYLKEVFQKYAKYREVGDAQARENYLALAGEVEARNVQTRVDLTPAERQRFNPIDTEDVVRAEQLSRHEPSLTTPYVVKHPYDGKPDFHTYD